MPQTPHFSAPDLSRGFGQLSRTLEKAPTGAVEAFRRGEEFEQESEIRGIEKETATAKLDEYQRKAQKEKMSREDFEEVKQETLRRLLGDEGHLALTGGKEVPTQGEKVKVPGTGPFDPPTETRAGGPPVEVGGIGKNMPYQDTVLLAKKIQDTTNSEELAEVMNSLNQVINKRAEVGKKYGEAIDLDKNPINATMFVPDEKGKIKYGDDYNKMVDRQVQTWRDKKLPAEIKKYAATAKQPNYEEFIQQHGYADTDLVRDEEMVEFIQQNLESVSKIKDRASRERAAALRASREGKKDEQNVALQNQKVLGLVDNKIASAEKTIESKVGAEHKALISTGKYLDPEATKNFTDAQRETLRKKGDEIVRLRKVREIPALATENGEFISLPQAEAIYDDALDGTFSSPLTKKYAPAIGMQESAPEEEPVEEPAAEPAAQAAAGEYTAEQETLIAQYEKKYPDRTRDQIISAMQKQNAL